MPRHYGFPPKAFVRLAACIGGLCLWLALTSSAWAIPFLNWQKASNGSDVAVAMEVDNQGNLLITGSSLVSNKYQGVTLKYSPSGALLWSRSFAPQFLYDEYNPVGLGLDDMGNVYITGTLYVGGDSTPRGYCTMKYLPNGADAPGWPQIYTGEYNDARALAIAVSKSTGIVHVFGARLTDLSIYQFHLPMIVAYHTDGSAHWSSGDIALMDKPPFDDNPVAMAVDSALNLYFTTARFDLDRENCWFYTSKLKNGGVVASGWPQEWKAYSQGNDNIPKAMAVDSSGNVYVTGTYYPPSKLYSYFVTLKYQPNGAMAAGWPQTGDDELYDYFDEGAALALDSHGNVIFVGTVDDLNHKKKICTIKYGPGGNTIWRQYHYNGLDVYGRAVVVDKKDNVYVAGYAAGLTTLLKYQADGKLAWHTTLNSCNPVGLGMGDKQAATGHVYVAGTFQIPVGLPHYFGARFSQVVTLPYDLLLLY